MAKRGASSHKKLFEFDLESLLISDLSPERQNDSGAFSPESSKPSKKLKLKDRVLSSADDVPGETEEPDLDKKEENEVFKERNDVATFFENVGQDFNKSMEIKKSKLGQFSDAVISVYQSKFSDLLKKQEIEINEFKERSVKNFDDELKKCEDEFEKLKQRESKLIKLLEQQLKVIQKTSETQSEWTENFRKLQKNFVEVFEELKMKHRNEALKLKQSVMESVCNLQNKFLKDSKVEEMQTLKKYLNSVYF